MYTCNLCRLTWSSKNSLFRHNNTVHAGERSLLSPRIYQHNICCYICHEKLITYLQLYRHLNIVHNIKITSEALEFTSWEEFQNWKCQIEKNGNGRFVQHSRSHKIKGSEERHLFYCHRSGTHVSKNSGKKFSKSIGSNKIGVTCPAQLTATKKLNGSTTVVYCFTHGGHDHDIRRIFLTKDERSIIAEKLRQGIPSQRISDDIRQSFNGDNIKRLDLLTSQDDPKDELAENIHLLNNLNINQELNDDDYARALNYVKKAIGCYKNKENKQDYQNGVHKSPANKNIQKQPVLYSIKKKKVEHQTVLQKPSTQEIKCITNNLSDNVDIHTTFDHIY